MAYLGSFSTTPIIPEFSCASYGDILFTDPIGKSDKFSEPVVQHNLASFWRRPGLFPISAGFPIPLSHTAAFGFNGVYSKAPGASLFSVPKRKVCRRNLICSELSDDTSEPGNVRIFAVNELSDGKTLTESEYSFINPYCKKETLFQLSHCETSNVIDLDSEAIQLKTFQADGVKRKLFIRTKDSLQFCDMENSTINKFFAAPVSDFFQVPYLNENLIVIDSTKRIWHGHMHSTLARKKVNFFAEAAAPTDCPKVVVATNGEEIRFVDLRESRESTDVLFKLEEPAFFDAASSNAFMSSMTEAHQQNKEEIFHLTYLPDRPFATIATSQRHHFLLDHRVPGQALITISHSNIDGGDYCFAAPPMKDSLRAGYIHTFFSLNHSQNNQATYWPLYINTQNSIWSSIGPIQTLQTPEIINSYYSSNSGIFPKSFAYDSLPNQTRSICYQPLATAYNIGETRALIFRQMNIGDIWYNTFIIDPLIDVPIDQKKFRLKSYRAIEKYFETAEDAEYFRQRQTSKCAEEAVICDPKTKLRCYQIVPNVEEISLIHDISEPSYSDPFNEIGKSMEQPYLIADDLVIQDTAEEDNIFSSIILKSWTKSDVAFMNYLNGTVEIAEDERSIDNNDDEMINVPASPVLEIQKPSTLLTPKLDKLVSFQQEPDEDDFNFEEMDFQSD